MTISNLRPQAPQFSPAGGGRRLLGPLAMMAAFSLMQGLPSYFFAVGLPALLRDGGASLATVGLTYVIWAPLALQWLWAPLFDAPQVPPFGGRLAWLRAMTILLALAFALVAAFPPGEAEIWPLLALSCLCSAIGATIRILLGAWLIAGADPRRRAWANAAGVAAMVFGGVAGGAAILHVGQNHSWSLAILSVSVAILVLSAPAWLIREEPPRPAPKASAQAQAERGLRVWAAFFGKPGAGRMLLKILGFGLVSGADVLVPAIMVDNGFSATRTLWILGSFAMAGVIPATALIGLLLARFGVFPVLAGLYALKLLALGGLALEAAAWIGEASPTRVAALSVVDYFLSGVLAVASWQLFMGFAAGPRSATDFGLLSSLDALARLLGGIAAGWAAQQAGYAPIFALAAAAAGAVALAACVLRPPLEGEALR